MNERCDGCRFYRAHANRTRENKDDWEGACRRFPPVFTENPEEGPEEVADSPIQWTQPVVFSTGWCGEFKATGQAS